MKLFYTSKTLWINLLAVLALFLESKFGYVLSAEIQIAILAIINLILRAITKEEIMWGFKKPQPKA